MSKENFIENISDEKLIEIVDKALKYEKNRNSRNIKPSLLKMIPIAAALVFIFVFVNDVLPLMFGVIDAGRPGSIALTTTPDVITIKDIIYNTELEELNLSELGLNDSDIMPLKHMENLTTLWLSWNNISDISVLKNLTDLTTIVMTGIGLGENINANTAPLDISVLKDLINLKELYLEYNKINDISALENLTNLTKLSLHNNDINDIDALKNLINLEELIISGNQITDVEILKEFKNLTRLDIFGNQITDNQIEELKNALPNCLIRITGSEKIND
jgi:Leucine-rich repeat (LRR) protein